MSKLLELALNIQVEEQKKKYLNHFYIIEKEIKLKDKDFLIKRNLIRAKSTRSDCFIFFENLIKDLENNDKSFKKTSYEFRERFKLSLISKFCYINSIEKRKDSLIIPNFANFFHSFIIEIKFSEYRLKDDDLLFFESYQWIDEEVGKALFKHLPVAASEEISLTIDKILNENYD